MTGHSSTAQGVPGTSPAFVRIALVFLLLAAAFLRVHGAADYYYSGDEAMETSIAGAGTLGDLFHFSQYDAHPPFFYVLCHYWMQISDSPDFVRCLPLTLGLLTILLYYAIGKRLHGEVTGLCCAGLVAFSHGCIIQSYVVRQYMPFFFFLSLAFYCYLQWRETHRGYLLAGYSFFGCLAAATHFSTLYAVACIGLCEAVSMLQRRAGFRVWCAWGAANLPILAITGLLVYLWLPVLTLMRGFYYDISDRPWEMRIETMLLYPLAPVLYLLPNITLTLPLSILGMTVAFFFPGKIERGEKWRFLLVLLGCALLLGMVLFITNLYTSIAGRHNFWVFPFLIPVAGWLLSDMVAWLANMLGQIRRWPWMEVLTAGVFAAGWLLYNPGERFAEREEYNLTTSDYKSMLRVFSGFGPRDLIVTERDDAVWLKNIYPALAQHPFSSTVQAMRVAYGNTSMLFNPYYRRVHWEESLEKMFSQADSQHMLDGVDRLVFFYSLYLPLALPQFVACPGLEKNITFFPPSASEGASPRDHQVRDAMAVVIIVPKSAFLANVLPHTAISHSCLREALQGNAR